MKTELLIHELSARVRPVRRIEHPFAGLLRWAALSALCVAGGMVAFGLRPDLGSAARSPVFLLLAALAVALGVVSTLSALLASVPGMDRPWLRAIPLGLVALAGAVLVCAALSGDGASIGSGSTCVERILALALLPSALVLHALRTTVPLAPRWVGMLAALGAMAPGVFAIQFICRYDDPLHVLVWHYLPVAVAACAGLVFGRLWLRWWTAR